MEVKIPEVLERDQVSAVGVPRDIVLENPLSLLLDDLPPVEFRLVRPPKAPEIERVQLMTGVLGNAAVEEVRPALLDELLVA